MGRMKILSASEQKVFETPPYFNAIERKKFFIQSLKFNDLKDGLRTPTNKVCFIVTAGYFHARRRFFSCQFHQKDIHFVAKQIGVDIKDIHLPLYDRSTYLRHKKLILDYFGFKSFDLAAKSYIETEIERMVHVQLRPKITFIEILQKLTQRRIALPSYATLSTLIVGAVKHRQLELNKIIKSNITHDQKEKLDNLFGKIMGSGTDTKWRYQITLLKKPNQSTRPMKIKENINDLNELTKLYIEMKPLITKLRLNSENLRYYAYSVLKSQVHQISRRTAENRYLHLLAFIAWQSLKLQDILIDTFLLCVQSVKNITLKNHRNIYYQEKEQRHNSTVDLVDSLQKDFLCTIHEIQTIVNSTSLTADQKVTAIAKAVNKKENIEASVTTLKKDIEVIHEGKSYYDILEESSLKLQNRVADIIKHTVFDENSGKPLLVEAILYYQNKSGNIDKHAPTTFLNKEQLDALTNDDGKFRVSLYKVFLFLSIADVIKSGVLNLVHSQKYLSLDDYLISKADWDQHKDKYMQHAELTDFSDCKKTLNLLNQELEDRYEETNNNFINNKNPYLTFRKDGTFHIKTPKLEETECLSLGTIFPDKKYISLLEVLYTVDQASGFLEEFEHWHAKYNNQKPDKKTFFAGIMAYGCDIGHRKFAQISKHINESELDNTLNWYFSLSNIQNANDKVLQFMDNMELPNIYLNEDNMLHTSSDGQKIEVAVDSLNANYSFKYLGKEKGSSVISFIDTRQFMWHSTVISSAEREAPYVIDGLMHNDVIKSDIHSTDTHGYSEVIFATTYLLGFTFAPRIKGIGHQHIYAFKNKENSCVKKEGFIPHKYINEELINAQWDGILRFIATIRLKTTTASQLFRRLNSYSKQHPLYKALKEFGKIPKSSFILNYADDPKLRQRIEKQLNKVEGSHKLSKAISIGSNSEFIQGEKEEQEIAEACRRLMKNAIISWNYMYLCKKIKTEKDEDIKKDLLDAIKNGSVMRWGHFNLHGEYDFADEKMVDSIGLALPKNTPKK